MRPFQFAKNPEDDFMRVLYARVDTFFVEKHLDKRANGTMLGKTIALFGMYAGIYVLILFSGLENLLVLFLLWALLGFLQSFIGMTIMHDAAHGAYSKSRVVNMLLEIPIILIGVESAIWKIEHNTIHHNYPNVNGIDQDIHPRYLFRFSTFQRKRWFHRFQHYYAVLLYALMVLEWTTIKDFMKVKKYYAEGFIKSRGEAFKLAAVIAIKKAIFHGVFLAIPIMVLPFEWYIVAAMYLSMAIVAGVFMTIIFQTAHVVPDCDFIADDVSDVPVSWHKHQLQTTANFSKNSTLVTHLLGGLNYQIEHHLFPGICHVHYPAIAGIVRSTAEEYQLPYQENSTLWSAVRGHFSLLKRLGRD